jgi:hypothetical protein
VLRLPSLGDGLRGLVISEVPAGLSAVLAGRTAANGGDMPGSWAGMYPGSAGDAYAPLCLA